MNAVPLSPDLARETLRQVIDPELNCNIVDLGLIYDVSVDGNSVAITMTLTTPGCPMHESIAWGVRNALMQIESVERVEVELVWDPPWSPALMTDVARVQLGIGVG